MIPDVLQAKVLRCFIDLFSLRNGSAFYFFFFMRLNKDYRQLHFRKKTKSNQIPSIDVLNVEKDKNNKGKIQRGIFIVSYPK